MNTNQSRNALGFSEILGGMFIVGGIFFFFLLCEFVPLIQPFLPSIEIYDEWERTFVISIAASL